MALNKSDRGKECLVSLRELFRREMFTHFVDIRTVTVLSASWELTLWAHCTKPLTSFSYSSVHVTQSFADCSKSILLFWYPTYCTLTVLFKKNCLANESRACLCSLNLNLGHESEHVIVCVCWLECFSAVESYLSFSQRKCDEEGTACRQRHEKRKREISINTAEQKAVLCMITWYCVSPLSSGCEGPIVTQWGLYFHILTS